MSATLEKLKAEVVMLPDQERAELAHFLLALLGPETDADVEAAWEATLARRAAEIESGKAVGRPAADVFARLREK
jgi:putative addiction module component (TIGR02574 family)